MIELTTTFGDRVAVNPMLVFTIEATATGTQIQSVAGGLVVVSEGFDDVYRRMKAWTKTP